MVTSDMPTYHRVVVYLIIVFSLRPFTGKDLLQYFGKCKQVFFLLKVIVVDSIIKDLFEIRLFRMEYALGKC